MDGDLGPGDRLPVESDLATRFGVSRSTVREALRLLSSQELVTTTRGTTGGTFVRLPEPEDIGMFLEGSVALLAAGDVVSVAELLEVRRSIEIPAAGFAAARAEQGQVEAVLEYAAPGTEPVGEARFELNRNFHIAVLAASRNPLFTVVALPVFDVLRRLFDRSRDDGQWHEVDNDHMRIAQAISDRRQGDAAREMEDHLRSLEALYEIFEQMP